MLVERKLGWNANYALEKFLPIYARWHLLHDNITNPIIQFDGIVKKRNLKGVSSYEVKWKDFDSVTVEPISLLRTRYDTQIQQFERNKLATKKTKSKTPYSAGRSLYILKMGYATQTGYSFTSHAYQRFNSQIRIRRVKRKPESLLINCL